MRWAGGRRSRNIEDRRGIGVPLGVGGGLGTVVLLLLALFFGLDPGAIVGTDIPGANIPTQVPPASPPESDSQADFVSVVLADTEDTWAELFREMNREYIPPRLVLFRSAAQSACGLAGSAVGPFYCPADHRVYLDLDFFRELSERFRAPGDFAQAYVIAHEVGHHVQALLGITERVAATQQRISRREANALSVRVELQADCLAGAWARQTGGGVWASPRFAPASFEDTDALYAHAARTLARIGFLDPARPRRLLPRLRRLFARRGLEHEEVNILRGILTAVDERLDGTRR